MITADTIHRLFCIQCDVTVTDFRHIFGAMGYHLWRKFQQCDYNLLSLYGLLDSHNGKLLADWVSERSQSLAKVQR